AGDQVDTFGGELVAGEVLPPAHDVEGLAGFGVVDVGEGRGLQPADLVAVVGAGALVVVEGDVGVPVVLAEKTTLRGCAPAQRGVGLGPKD
ncbi:hypothetical protein, partial [Streptomyces spectabilis]|uniref:hypothetical protein n=1 Tax=Streptomyces spectabilis TaxID=68270 RepID=UPI001C8711F3